MADHKASRTLVKSAPELWAECSDATSLTRHLEAFGEIRITRLEPETAVAWEGDAVSGTVRLEPSGWGTRVILTAAAQPPAPAAAPTPSAAVSPPVPPAAQPPPPAAVQPPPPRAVQPPASAAVSPARQDEPPAEQEESDEPENPAEQPAGGAFSRLLALIGWGRRPGPDPDPEPDQEAPAREQDQEAPAREQDQEAPARESAQEASGPQGAQLDSLPRRARPGRPAPLPWVTAALDGALDSLGRAHHRPYSRA